MGGERKREENLCDGRRGNCVRWERERCNNIRKGRVTTILCQGGEGERDRDKFAREGGRATNKYRQTNQRNKKKQKNMHASKCEQMKKTKQTAARDCSTLRRRGHVTRNGNGTRHGKN